MWAGSNLVEGRGPTQGSGGQVGARIEEGSSSGSVLVLTRKVQGRGTHGVRHIHLRSRMGET